MGNYFAPWQHKALAAVVVVALTLPAAVLVTAPLPGALATLGFIATYLLYEILHRRAHTVPPRTRYGRWRRKNHFAHHFVDPRCAYGVTTPLWDWVFGTGLTVAQVRVPRRLSMPWLTDKQGEILSAYRRDYVLVGSADRDARSMQSDRVASLANRRPAD